MEKVRPRSFLLAFSYVVFLWIIVPLFLIFLNNNFGLPIYKNPFYEIIGSLLVLIGVVIAFSCVGMFFKIGKGTPVPMDPPKHLVATGPYKFTRNPMYLAEFLIFLGEFFFLGHLLLLLYFLLSISVLHVYVVYFEEPKLKSRFGDEYLDYIKRVPRWLGHLPQ